MAELFNITHDADNLNEYDVTVTDGGDLSTGTPGLASTTARMEALIDDTTAIYAYKNFSLSGSDLRWRFYIDPNTLTIPTGTSFVVNGCYNTDEGIYIVKLYLYWDSTNGYRIGFRSYEDDGSSSITYHDISDAEHYVEVHADRATGVAAGDGQAILWIDGVLKQTDGSLDNWDLLTGNFRGYLGAIDSIDANTAGTLHSDEFKANDDGSEIGPVTPPAGQPMNLRGITVPHLRQWQPRAFS